MYEKYFQIIINEISKLINADICFIDCLGYIVESTQLSRIGQFHAYAKKLVDENLDQLIVEQDDPVAGTRKGIHSAVRLNSQIIGVIGITGEPDEISLFSKAICVLSELMLKNLLSNEQDNILIQARSIFFQECLLHNSHISQEQYLSQGLSLGLNMELPRTIIVIRFLNLPSQCDLLLSGIVSHCNNPNNKNMTGSVTFLKGTDIICFHPCASSADSLKYADYMKKQVENKFKIKTYIGCSNIYTKVNLIPALFETACLLADISKNSDGQIIQQGHLFPEALIKSLPQSIRQEFYTEIFHNCTNTEVDSYTQLLTDYFKYNGSIKDISEKHYVHKNTVQYQLTKIHQQTGYNPRNMRDAFCLYLALLTK